MSNLRAIKFNRAPMAPRRTSACGSGITSVGGFALSRTSLARIVQGRDDCARIVLSRRCSRKVKAA
jgi:hypothetical protein